MTADLILATLLRVNLAAAAAILLVLVVRLMTRRAMGPRAAYGLWLAVPAAALASLIPARMVQVLAAPAAPSAPGGTVAFWLAEPVAAQRLDLTPIFIGLWLTGAAAALIVALVRTRRVAAAPYSGPALVGVFRPRLILPTDFETRFDERERRLILAHEDVHQAARHPLINGLIELLRCLNWFNPLIHIAAFYARVDQELACDAAVIAKHPRDRGAYAGALLKSQLSPAFLPLGCQWPGRSKSLLSERIEMIAHPKGARRLAGAAAVTALAAATGFAAWAAQPPRAVPAPVVQPRAQVAPTPLPKTAVATPAPVAAKPEPPAKLEDICLTNACGKPAIVEIKRNEAAIAAALKANQVVDLILAGGSATEAGTILRAICGRPDQPSCQGVPKAGSEKFRVANGAIVIIGQPDEAWNGPQVQEVMVNTIDMAGLPPRPDMPVLGRSLSDGSEGVIGFNMRSIMP